MSKKSILLVDDDPVILITVRKQLEQYEFDIETAASGEIAVEMLDEKLLLVEPETMVGYTHSEVGGPAENRPFR